MRVALLADDALFPTNSGGRAEVLGECKALQAAGIDITLVVSHRGHLSPETISLHENLVDRVFFYRRANFVRTTLTRPLDPYQIASRVGPSGEEVLRVMTPDIDAIIASHEWTIPLANELRSKTGQPILLRSHNDEVSYMQALTADAQFVRKFYYHAEAIRLKRLLRSLYSKIETVAVLSSLDEGAYLRYGAATILIPPILAGLAPTTMPRRMEAPANSDILFVGALDIPHAVSGLTWFIREVLPRIKLQCPNALVHVVGRRASEKLRNELVETPSVVFHGEVSDLSPLYSSSRVFVNPTFSGSGVNMKMGPPSEYGLPIVTTTVGRRGLGDLVDHRFVGDNSSAFAKACAELINDDDLWLRISAHVQKVIGNYSPAAIGKLFAQALNNISSSPVRD